jgi:anti-sigma-K factor RskA
MHTQHIDDQAEAYALGILDSPDREMVEQHLEVCPPCRNQVRGVEESAHLLGFAAPPVAPPSRCKARIMEKIERERFLATPTRRQRGPVRAALWANLAAVAALMLLGVWSINLQRKMSQLESRAELTQSQVATVSTENAVLRAQLTEYREFDTVMARSAAVRYLEGMGPAADASAETYMTPGENTALLVVRNLPALPDGKVYQVWVARSSEQQPLSTFDVDAPDQLVKLKIAPPEPMDRYSEIMVTIEDAGGASAPSDETVLAGNL